MKRSSLEAALGHHSASATWRLQARSGRNSTGQASQATEDLEPRRPTRPSGAFKRKVAVTRAPFARVFRVLHVPAIEGEDTAFAFADMRQLLPVVSRRCPCLREVLARAASRRETLRVVPSQDECTAGNVLATEARQRVVFLYLTFQQYEDALVSPHAWVAISCVTHEQAQRTRGGMGAITATWMDEWSRQQLDTAFQVDGLVVRLALSNFVADFEAMRESYAAMGSSGIRPCFLCENIVMKASGAPEVDPQYCWISEADVSRFRPMLDSEVAALMDRQLQRLPELSAAALQLRERCLGFHITPDSIWSAPSRRSLLRLEIAMNDQMHCYFAQGIASQELQLYLTAVRETTGITMKNIADCVVEGNWLRPGHSRSHGESKHWQRRLFRDSLWRSGMFKGSASQCITLIPLVRWLTLAMGWNRLASIRPQYESFKHLCRCVDALKAGSRNGTWQDLGSAQEQHQKAFMRAYEGHERPKHHHRMHLPEQYQRQGLVLSCWATEAKHKMYKGDLARCVQHFIQEADGGRLLSVRLLPQLLLRHCSSAAENRLLLYGKHELLQELSAKKESLASACDVHHGTVAKRLRVGMLDVRKDDIIMHGPDWTRAALCHFFYRNVTGSLCLGATPLRLTWQDESQTVFGLATPTALSRESLEMPRLPAWHHRNATEVVCIL